MTSWLVATCKQQTSVEKQATNISGQIRKKRQRKSIWNTSVDANKYNPYFAFLPFLSILSFEPRFKTMILDKSYIFASSAKNKMLSQMLLLPSFFISYISPELVAFFHVIWFIKTGCFNFCLFLPFKYFVFCGKKWFSTKDICSLLLWSTKRCLRCYFFFPLSTHVFHLNWLLFFTSCVSSKVVAFFISYVSSKMVAFFLRQQ